MLIWTQPILDPGFEEMVDPRLHFVGKRYPLLGCRIVQSIIILNAIRYYILALKLRCLQTPANSSQADWRYPSFDLGRARTQSLRFCSASSFSAHSSWSQEILWSHQVIVITALLLPYDHQNPWLPWCRQSCWRAWSLNQLHHMIVQGSGLHHDPSLYRYIHRWSPALPMAQAAA